MSRQTVSGWLNSNFGVQAALNRRRHELWSEVSDRLRPLVPKALDTVATPLDAGDVKPALVLKATGLSDLRPTGSTDTGELEADAEDRDYALSLRG